MKGHVCPACGGPAGLVHRKRLDRILSAFYKVHRYACGDEACGWQGLLHSTHRRTGRKAKGLKPWMWVVVFLVSAAAATAMIVFLDSRSPAEGAESATAP
jgi:hypothetical protein